MAGSLTSFTYDVALPALASMFPSDGPEGVDGLGSLASGSLLAPRWILGTGLSALGLSDEQVVGSLDAL